MPESREGIPRPPNVEVSTQKEEQAPPTPVPGGGTSPRTAPERSALPSVDAIGPTPARPETSVSQAQSNAAGTPLTEEQFNQLFDREDIAGLSEMVSALQQAEQQQADQEQG